MMTNDQRGTGRTTRMLEDAFRLAKEGRAVYVMAANVPHTRLLEYMAGQTTARELGIKFETPSSLDPFDWDRMRTRGMHPNCVVLVDHYTIESLFGPLLEMLHRYDWEDI